MHVICISIFLLGWFAQVAAQEGLNKQNNNFCIGGKTNEELIAIRNAVLGQYSSVNFIQAPISTLMPVSSIITMQPLINDGANVLSRNIARSGPCTRSNSVPLMGTRGSQKFDARSRKEILEAKKELAPKKTITKPKHK